MTEPGAQAYRLHVLGARDLRAPDGARVTSVLAQPKRLCLLTYLALSPNPVSRATLAALFWPESDESRARNALSQALHYLRRSLGEDVLPSVEGDRVTVSADRLWCDARALLEGAPVGDAAGRDLLEGWNADDSQPLQEWLDHARRALRARAAELGADAPRIDPTPPSFAGTKATADVVPATRRSHTFAGAWSLVVAAALAVVLIVAAMARPRVVDQTVMVILPRVDVGTASSLNPLTIHDELLAHLHRPGLRVVSAPYFRSIDELRRQMAGLDARVEPTWVVHVTAHRVGDEAKVFGFLYHGPRSGAEYHGPSFEVAEVVTFLLTTPGSGAVLLTAPDQIADSVAKMVDRVLTESSSR
jgi:hypothetical protein